MYSFGSILDIVGLVVALAILAILIYVAFFKKSWAARA